MTFKKIFLFLGLPLLFQTSVFVEEVIDDKIQIGYGLAVGDVDGDKKPDILLADKKQFVWYRNGDWKRFVMIENLTESDNVCIAARDIDGDGRVEVAVGAQWNPSETTDSTKSGSVHFLIRPHDPTKLWRPVKLHHEPTIHRMKWVKVKEKKYQLIVLPLHGKANNDGQGAGVNVIAFEVPSRYDGVWKYSYLDQEMHMTHNLDVVANGVNEKIYVGGKEGVKLFLFKENKWVSEWAIRSSSFGEVRQGMVNNRSFITGVEPMHGNVLSIYADGKKTMLTDGLKQGHAIATADLLKDGSDQIVVGWREPDAEGKTGIKLFFFSDGKWISDWIDENGIACEDLVISDLDGDGNKDIIAAGRATHNLKIYWNKN
jgi:FG-GAP-like repeat